MQSIRTEPKQAKNLGKLGVSQSDEPTEATSSVANQEWGTKKRKSRRLGGGFRSGVGRPKVFFPHTGPEREKKKG